MKINGKCLDIFTLVLQRNLYGKDVIGCCQLLMFGGILNKTNGLLKHLLTIDKLTNKINKLNS